MPKGKTPGLRKSGNFIRFTGLAFQMIGTILFFLWLGVKLDQWAGMKFPVFKLVMILAGVGGSMYYAIKEVSK